jgi:hypothetical protein
MTKRLHLDQQYLTLTAAEAQRLAREAPDEATFCAVLYVELSDKDHKDVGKKGEARIYITREVFINAAEQLLDYEAEAKGARIPVTVAKYESGVLEYWIG